MVSENDGQLQFFQEYLKLVGTPYLEAEETEDDKLYGKTVGLVNAASWIEMYCYYFGRKHLPGVKLVNVGNEAVQLNFIKANELGLACPPQENIELFGDYAEQLVKLANGVDAVMITCSTMNRSLPEVKERLKKYGIPVLAIDQPMMEKAVRNGGETLIIATVQTTVNSTKALLEEAKQEINVDKSLVYHSGVLEEAFSLLGEGKVVEHNEMIANFIREKQKDIQLDQVILAQLSMSVFTLSYPNPEETFGIPIYTSGDEGFKALKEVLINTNKEGKKHE